MSSNLSSVLRLGVFAKSLSFHSLFHSTPNKSKSWGAAACSGHNLETWPVLSRRARDYYRLSRAFGNEPGGSRTGTTCFWRTPCWWSWQTSGFGQCTRQCSRWLSPQPWSPSRGCNILTWVPETYKENVSEGLFINDVIQIWLPPPSVTKVNTPIYRQSPTFSPITKSLF